LTNDPVPAIRRPQPANRSIAAFRRAADTTLDFGGRYKLRPGIIALFMAGRSINGDSDGQPLFMGYIGIQILLSDYGRRFTVDP
jgi:hypothetical protein